MNEEDADIWRVYAAGVKKIGAKDPKGKQRKKPEKKAKKEVPACSASPDDLSSSAPCVRLCQAPPALPEPLDVRVERNLSLGDVVIEARLDLHGKTEEDAFALFAAFMEKHYALSRRLVLVITGKGKDGRSVLRANLPRWCAVAPFDSMVRAVREAAPLHGGAGAYYILLRKKK